MLAVWVGEYPAIKTSVYWLYTLIFNRGEFFPLYMWTKYQEHRPGAYIQATQARLQLLNVTITCTVARIEWWWNKILDVFQRIDRGFKSTSTQQVKSNFRLSWVHGQAVMKYWRWWNWYLSLSASITYNIWGKRQGWAKISRQAKFKAFRLGKRSLKRLAKHQCTDVTKWKISTPMASNIFKERHCLFLFTVESENVRSKAESI